MEQIHYINVHVNYFFVPTADNFFLFNPLIKHTHLQHFNTIYYRGIIFMYII